MTILQEKHPVTGEPTGATSLARVLAFVFAVLSVVVIGVELGVDTATRLGLFGLEANPAHEASAARYAIGVALGVVSVGFYLGKARGAFDKALDRLLNRGN